MGRDTDIIALVGAGEQGRAVLEALLRVTGLEVRYVFDDDPEAPGIALARENGICCRTDGGFGELSADADVDVIIETTGRPKVLTALEDSRRPGTRLIHGAGTRLVSRLLVELTDVGERAAIEQARYLRQASHQLKSPLSSVQSYVNVILGGYAGEVPEQVREIVEKVHAKCAAALLALAKRRVLADVRCVYRGGLEMTTVHLGRLVDQAAESQTALAEARNVEIRVTSCRGPDLVRCDPQKTVVLLSELIENAVVYSDAGGPVEVATTADAGGRLAVAVRDHGIGIPSRALPRVFDEDYRADPAVRHHPDGAGLGLTIAREIAGLQRFTLTAESEEGRGSLFTLTLPRAPAT